MLLGYQIKSILPPYERLLWCLLTPELNRLPVTVKSFIACMANNNNSRNKMNSKSRTIRPKGKPVNKREQNLNRFLAMQRGTSLISRIPGHFMPDVFVCKLRYILSGLYTSAGASLSQYYRTSAFDVDPVLASTAMPGYAELAAMYRRYRVLSMHVKATVVNDEAHPVHIIHGFSADTFTFGTFTINYGSNPGITSSVMSPVTGQNLYRIDEAKAVTEILGDSSALVDDQYAAITSSNPARMANWNIGLSNPTNVFTARGVEIQGYVELETAFINRVNLVV